MQYQRPSTRLPREQTRGIKRPSTQAVTKARGERAGQRSEGELSDLRFPPNNSSTKMCHPLLCSPGKLTPLNLTLIICESSIKPYGAVGKNRNDK